MQMLAERLRDFIVGIYQTEIPQEDKRPSLEILLSGYSKLFRKPEIFRLIFQWDWGQKQFTTDARQQVAMGDYNVVFGGQYDVIQRVVHGIDFPSWLNLQNRCEEVLKNYKAKIEDDLLVHGHNVVVIPPDPNDADLQLNTSAISGLFANVADLSEKAGIEFVEFLILTMVKAQEFSASIPTVGGDIHLGLLTKNSGFSWIKSPYSARAGNQPHP
jgi:hypothetical protein